MAQVTNPTQDTLEVPSLKFSLAPGESIEVGDEAAALLPSPPFEVAGLPVKAVPEAQPAGSPPSDPAAATTPADTTPVATANADKEND